MTRNPVGWFEIYVQDMDRAKAFYENVLSRTLEALAPPGADGSDMEMWAFPMQPEAGGAAGGGGAGDDDLRAPLADQRRKAGRERLAGRVRQRRAKGFRAQQPALRAILV